MDRRKFLKGSSLLTGLFALNPFEFVNAKDQTQPLFPIKNAKNIIFMVSDGMSSGTLSMTDIYSRSILGKTSEWMSLYHENKVARGLMDTASASSIVTDSSAASSSFGGGVRVKNGVLNVGPNGEQYLPIWQKFKKKGKKAGCVTTVTITHATPAGFCVNSESRNSEPEIAKKYADLGFDVLMGGGDEFFNAKKRKDGVDLYDYYKQKGYQVVDGKNQLSSLSKNKKTLGIFSQGALPYTADKNTLAEEYKNVPSLAEMTKSAIDQMKDNKEGFVLQVESGKVDWAAHANDIAGLIHEQLAFDEALKTVIDFAEKDGNTLVIFTTDHGNANPGIIYDSKATTKFDSISNYKYTNEFVLNGIKPSNNLQQVKDWIKETNGISLPDEDAKHLLSFYTDLEKEDGLYNYKKLPYKLYSEIQKKSNSVGWISMDHSGDYVEVAAYGPGKELLKPHIKNTDLHYLMLQAAGVENKF